MKPALIMLALVLSVSLVAKEKLPAPDTDEIVTLDPFKVHGTAISSYALDLRIVVSSVTKKIISIVITRVEENSDAAALGLQPGDEIMKVDGISVRDMDSKVNRDSQLGRLFLNRRAGEPLKLEVITHRPQQITLRAQALPGL